MGKSTVISMAVVRRLPRYRRYLSDLLENGIDRISSKELSERMGLTASQIRQDFNCFGDFGQQGYGYNVRELYAEIARIIGLNKAYNTVIVGAGNIGQAIANYSSFSKLGFNLMAIFDVNPKLIGLKFRDIDIRDVDNLDEFLQHNKVDIGIICVPKIQAQRTADIFQNRGVRAIWNFAPIDLKTNEGTIVENVHLSDSLLTLSYRLNETELFSKEENN
ncbi:MAG: redox-sensing transcriptional repressor Rex [Clostridium sp.]|uniref:redox-sensing transcriptional repressor Rex n=1 Tax=Clostridium sp. TaxID=1506 RepID=UPI002FC61351